jgi:hypothetical protein
MEIFRHKDRSKYLQSQIDRSNAKYSYCKVNINKTLAFKSILEPLNLESGPILCLGTRNGREIDLFRNVFFKNQLLVMLIRLFERRVRGFNSIFPSIEGFDRSNVSSINDESVIGVEVNPAAAREDVWIGSFDEMPKDWNDKFSILYSNSFDQSQDPFKTAEEWKRVARKGAILIFGYSDAPPTESDPIGYIHHSDILELFGGKLLYDDKDSFNYSYVIIKL